MKKLSRTLHISAMHLSETDQKVFDVAVKIVCDENNTEYLTISDLANSEILVVDYNNEDAREILRLSKSHNVKIVFADKNIEGKNIVTVKKPVRVLALKNVLEAVSKQLYTYISNTESSSRIAQPGVAADVRQSTTETHTDIPVDAHNLFEKLLQAKTQQACLHISAANLPDVYIDGKNKSFLIETNSDDIDKYIRLNFNEIKFEPVDCSKVSRTQNTMHISALNNILWRCALDCSNGELLTGHTLDKPVKLKSWPNFSRQGFKPEYFKLSAILARQYMSMTELNKQTQVAMESIINFYNAAFAVDILETKTGSVKHNKPVVLETRKKKTILGKIAQRLRIDQIL